MPTKLPNDERIYSTVTCRKALDTMSLKRRKVAFDMFDFHTAQCKRIDKEVDALSVAVSIHDSLDAHMQHTLATSPHRHEVKCQRGCAHCCRNYVGIFPHEGRLLREFAAEQGVEIDEGRLARQAQKTEKTWQTLAPEDQDCVFLGEDQACKVYEHRPGSCRKYLVITDPEQCDAVKHPGGEVAVIFNLEAEVMYSAAMTGISTAPL